MLHVLENEVWQVGVLPGTGMSTAFGRLRHGGAWTDLMRPTAESAYGTAGQCANYFLIPWSNRVRDARFRFRGTEYQLRSNEPAGTALHGTTRDFSWKVEQADRGSIVASFDSRQHQGVNFPFAFSARAELRLEGARFETDLSLKNEGKEPMPAGFGHHPYFQRAFAGEADSVRLEVPCAEYFPLEKGLPRAGRTPVDARVDFRKMRELGDVQVDDCLTARTPGAPIRFSYARSGLAVAITADPLFEQIVVYTPTGKTFFAVEPVTNANDGFNLFDQGVPGSGVFVLEPGEMRKASSALEVEGGSR